MKVPIYNQQAGKVGEVDLPVALFEVKPSEHLIAEAVRVQLSNARPGLANTKTRGEVRGGGKKPWKQKGTGRARAGSNRSPIWRHGGVTFGPKSNRNWNLKMNRTAKTKALLMALSDKVSNQKLFVVDKVEFPEAKTKLAAKFVSDFGKALAFGKKQLLIVPNGHHVLVRTLRNIPAISTISAKNLNIVEIIKNNEVILLQEALTVMEDTFRKQMSKGAKI
jgi:large subunit ribosomal protein L4